MKKIRITDITLSAKRTNTESTLSFKERIEVARFLQNLDVDIIELGGITDPRTDPLLVRTVSAFAKKAVLSVSAGTDEASIAAAAAALSGAAHPRLRIELPVSTVQMEYSYHKKDAKMLAFITQTVSAAKDKCADVEFCALDATRAEPEFLEQAINAAIDAGAATVTLCDTAGKQLPDDFAAFVKDLRQKIFEPAGVHLGICCSDHYGLALGCTLLALRAGADEVKVTTGGRETVRLESFARLLHDEGDSYGFCAALKYTELERTIKQIRRIIKTKRSETSPFDTAFSATEQHPIFRLNSNDPQSEVARAVVKLGYDLSEEDMAKVYEAFCEAAEKKTIGERELDAIVASVALQVPPTYKLIRYAVNSSNLLAPSAHIVLQKDGKELSGLCLGDGPIDAAFLAIEQIVGHHYELDDFQIQAVTEGREALGSAFVRIRSGGRLYSGNGTSTDILGACIAAYLNALNKIAYEEG